MSDAPPNLSRSVEDYLKAIYVLSEQGEPATTSNIAARLSVQPASVTGMVKRLAESGYIRYQPYRGAHLTAVGTREALRILRRHRLLETYLVERLGFTWDDVHEEAERLEHAASDELIERMAAALGHPAHDPHGAPIPTPGGEIEAVDYSTLAEVPSGEVVEIQAVQDDDSERLRYLESQGLLPGTRLSVEARAPFDGPLTIRLGVAGGESQVVGLELARMIYVTAAD